MIVAQIFVSIFAIILFSLALIFLYASVAEKIGLVDNPDARKLHEASTPLAGGLALYTVFAVFMVLFPLPEKLEWMLICSGVLVIVGTLDDYIGLGVVTRLFFQVVTTCLMILGGGLWITNTGFDSLFGLSLHVNLAMALTVVAIVGLTNSFNMVDGIDGLAAGHMLVSLATLVLALIIEHSEIYQLVWLSLLASSVLGFFLVNAAIVSVRKVFLGDAGSLLLGFVMGWTLIYYSQPPIGLIPPIVALWCVAIPVVDTVFVVVVRCKNGRSPFEADRRHLHHAIIDSGQSPKRALWILLLSSLVIQNCGALISLVISETLGLILYTLLLTVTIYMGLRSRDGLVETRKAAR